MRITLRTSVVLLFIWGLGPAIGALAELAEISNATVDPRFFAVSAEIAPAFGLALFVSLVVVMNQVVSEQGLTPTNKALGRTLVHANAGLLVVAEGMALFAVARGKSSAFLVVSIVVPLLEQVYLFVAAALVRLGVNIIRTG
jgi:hypothetical protein